MRQVRRAHPLEPCRSAYAALPAREAGEPEGDVAEPVEMGEERIVLRQVPETPVLRRDVGMRVEEDASIERDASAVWPGHAEKKAQQSRLSRSVRSSYQEGLGAHRQLERQL